MRKVVFALQALNKNATMQGTKAYNQNEKTITEGQLCWQVFAVKQELPLSVFGIWRDVVRRRRERHEYIIVIVVTSVRESKATNQHNVLSFSCYNHTIWNKIV